MCFYYYLLCADVWEGQLRRVKREALSISEQRGQCVRFSWSGGGICQSVRNDRVVCKGHGNYWWMRRALIGTEEKNQWMDDGCVWVCVVAWVCAYKYMGEFCPCVTFNIKRFPHVNIVDTAASLSNWEWSESDIFCILSSCTIFK